MIACRTGDACGLTLTRSGASSTPNHSAVISDTIDALDAWWPPTFTPDAVRPHAVGVVDDRRREPQHAALDLVEHLEVDVWGRGGRRGHAASLAAGPAQRVQSG